MGQFVRGQGRPGRRSRSMPFHQSLRAVCRDGRASEISPAVIITTAMRANRWNGWSPRTLSMAPTSAAARTAARRTAVPNVIADLNRGSHRAASDLLSSSCSAVVEVTRISSAERKLDRASVNADQRRRASAFCAGENVEVADRPSGRSLPTRARYVESRPGCARPAGAAMPSRRSKAASSSSCPTRSIAKRDALRLLRLALEPGTRRLRRPRRTPPREPRQSRLIDNSESALRDLRAKRLLAGPRRTTSSQPTAVPSLHVFALSGCCFVEIRRLASHFER